jgi:hypothetical protein
MPTSPAIEFIHETLYATLADMLCSTPSLLPLLKTDLPRAYFGAVALAILAVSSTVVATTLPTTPATPMGEIAGAAVFMGVRGVLLTLAACPTCCAC